MSGSDIPGTGSVADVVSRMRAVLPGSWFPLSAPGAFVSVTPVLDGLLAGIGQGWSYCYALMRYVIAQSRIQTASGGLLDMICADFFGGTIKRQTAEADGVFRSRIQANILLPRATRSALSNTLSTLLGFVPVMFEPWRAADTGGYGGTSAAAAGGGGGYGSQVMALGSSHMPFQYLVAASSGASWTRRESQATFLDANNAMQIAPRRVLRYQMANTVVEPLIEGRSFNLIKDSEGWSGCNVASPGGVASWMIDVAGAKALWAGKPVMCIDVLSKGSFTGPLVKVPLAVGPVTVSVWVMLPLIHQLQSLELAVNDETGTFNVPVDITKVGVWQRISITYPLPTTFPHSLSVSLTGQSLGQMTAPVLTQCWQVEPGSVATSYIPSSGQLGIREADDPVLLSGGSSIDMSSLNEAIGRVVPAGSVAWTTLLI